MRMLQKKCGVSQCAPRPSRKLLFTHYLVAEETPPHARGISIWKPANGGRSIRMPAGCVLGGLSDGGRAVAALTWGDTLVDWRAEQDSAKQAAR